MLFNLAEPILNVIERILFRAVVDKQYTHCSFVVGLCNGSEPLLPRRVPNLQFDRLVIKFDRFNSEVNSYRWHVAGGKLIV